MFYPRAYCAIFQKLLVFWLLSLKRVYIHIAISRGANRISTRRVKVPKSPKLVHNNKNQAQKKYQKIHQKPLTKCLFFYQFCQYFPLRPQDGRKACRAPLTSPRVFPLRPPGRDERPAGPPFTSPCVFLLRPPG